MKTPSDLIRECYRAYETKDRSAIEPLLAQDFTFSSPLDDAISRELYFERCWPNSDHVDFIHVEKLFVQGNEAFAQYEQGKKGGGKFRNTEFFTIRDGRISHVDVYFGRDSGANAGTKDEIRAVIEAWASAIRRKDVDGVLANFAEDSVRFYLAPPLQADQPLRQNLEDWFATFDGKIGYEIRDLAITAGSDTAYSHSFNRINGRNVGGEISDLWFRETLCFRLMEGRWRITHTHESVPFYMDGSHRAATDLKPK